MKFLTVGGSREEAHQISQQKFDEKLGSVNTKNMSPAERKELWEMTLKTQEKICRTSLRYYLTAELLLCGSLLGFGYLITKDSGIGARR